MVKDCSTTDYWQADVRQLALQRSKFAHLTDEQFRFFLQQVEGRQTARQKLPEIAAIDYWQYPPRLSMQQCSSEQTAKYKAQIISEKIDHLGTLIDLTGGLGVDTFYLSAAFERTIYVERQAALCAIAQHNFALTKRQIQVVNEEAEQYLGQAQTVDCVFIDPARRDANGGKVYRLEDCEPNVVELLPLLERKCRFLLLKLSPMLDLQVALRSLPQANEVYVVAWQNEVKELLMLCEMSAAAQPWQAVPIQAVNLTHEGAEKFCFTIAEEQQTEPQLASLPFAYKYLYEPNTAILKAGAFRLVAARYGLQKLARDSHLYASDRLITDFQGRVFSVEEMAEKKRLQGKPFNVISRNYPLSAPQISGQFRLRDGGDKYLIATRVGSTPMMLVAQRVK